MSRVSGLAYFALSLSALVLTTEAHAGKCPNVGIVLDKSGSMAGAPNGQTVTATNPAKWTVAVDAITKLTNTYDGVFPLGLVFFPDRSLGNPGCSVRTGLDVPVGYGTKAAILDILSKTSPNGSTPTGSAIDSARMDPALKDATRSNYLLLITDGQPCCSGSTCTDFAMRTTEAVNAITAAKNATPSVKTFVVGFGQLDANFQSALNQMADAGGVPAATTGNIRFFQADSAASLDAALDKIVKTVTGGGGDVGGSTVLCDDTCYSNACPAGQICNASMCKADQCMGKSCPDGQYCFFDGSAASCVSSCTMTCPLGQRCVRGACVENACPVACAAGRMCDTATGTCVIDPSCAGKLCKATQGCFAGKCVDDPCAHITCPDQTGCVPFEGTCLAFDLPPPGEPGGTISACSCDLGRSEKRSTVPAALAAGLLFAALLRQRRRAA